jgi:hypothetical protein
MTFIVVFIPLNKKASLSDAPDRLVDSHEIYLKPTAACQTNANAKKNSGIIGSTSTSGSKI